MKTILISVFTVAVSGILGCATLDPAPGNPDSVEKPVTMVTEKLICLGDLIDKDIPKNVNNIKLFLVFFINIIPNGTSTPNATSSELSWAGHAMLKTALVGHIGARNIIVPETTPEEFESLNRNEKTAKFALFELSAVFSEYDEIAGHGISGSTQVSNDASGGRINGEVNSTTRQIAIDYSIVSLTSRVVIKAIALRTQSNRRNYGFNVALGSSGVEIGVGLGDFRSDGIHTKQRALIEAGLYEIVAAVVKEQMGIRTEQCSTPFVEAESPIHSEKNVKSRSKPIQPKSADRNKKRAQPKKTTRRKP